MQLTKNQKLLTLTKRLKGLRCKREEVLGKNLWNVFPNSKFSQLYTEFHRPPDQRRSTHFEEYYAPLDIWISVHTYPNVGGLSVYFIDTTSKHRYLEMIQKQNEKLCSISRMHSHEIRGPLSSIMGLIPLFDFKQQNSAYNQEILMMLQKAAYNLDKLISEINNAPD